MIKSILAKTILSKVKNAPEPFFGLSYNMNLYRGCQHACIYCDSRSSVYGIKNFRDIEIKENALELLEKELRSKRVKGTISFGSMNDPYMPVDQQTELTRDALKIINRYRFPVHIITKSTNVLRDIDLLQQTSKTYAAVSFSITAANVKLSKIIEPGAPVSSERFNAIRELNKSGVYSGMVLTPVLPFITDSKENIEELVQLANEYEAKYILGWMGMTQRNGQREYYYRELDRLFPGIKAKYIHQFGNEYFCAARDFKELEKHFYHICKQYHIPNQMEFFESKEPEQLNLFS